MELLLDQTQNLYLPQKNGPSIQLSDEFIYRLIRIGYRGDLESYKDILDYFYNSFGLKVRIENTDSGEYLYITCEKRSNFLVVLHTVNEITYDRIIIRLIKCFYLDDAGKVMGPSEINWKWEE